MTRMDRETGRVALIGWPVAHSVSPAMHNAAFEALGLDWRYELLPTEPGRVAEAVARLRAGDYQGANVTVPHKQAVLPCLDELTGAAQAMGAANTLVPRGGRLIGHNTDADGFVVALLAAGLQPHGAWAAVVGAGGAARAVVYALLGEGAEKIFLLNRSVERARALADDLDCRDGGPPRIEVRPLDEGSLVATAQRAELLVHATPLGMWPHVDASIWPDDVPLPEHLAVFDLVYNPQETRLLQQAHASGAKAIGGLEMLVQQGVLAFQIWTGERAPVGVMRRAARRALAGER
jgi:shikimate dehydrogenase